MEASNDNPVGPGVLERIEGAIERARDRVPNLTTGLIVATLVIGLAGGAWASKPLHRYQINKEWHAKLAASSKAVREAMARGDAEAEATDEEVLNALGDQDAQLYRAELALASARRAALNPSDCRIPAGSLH